MSYPKLVTLLRQGLQSLYNSATKLERQWLKEALLPQSSLPRLKRQQTDTSRTKRDPREIPTIPIIESPSTQRHQVETAKPSLPLDSACSFVEKPKKSGPNRVRQVENPTAVNPELWESQLRLGLAIMEKRLRKR